MKPKAAAATACPLRRGGSLVPQPRVHGRTEGGRPRGPHRSECCHPWGLGRRVLRAAQSALCPAEGPALSCLAAAGGGTGGDHWSRLAMPDARWGRAQQPAAHRAGPALGPASPLCAGSRAARPAMRWLWPLGVSLAVALAAGPERAPGGVRLQQGGHQPAAQEQPDRSRRGAEWEDAKRLQQYVPEGWAEYPRPIRPAALQPTQPRVAASPSPDWARETGGSGQEPRGNVTGTPGRRLQVQNPLYPVTERSYGAYAILLVALVLFAVGIVGSLAVMCVVWHSYYLKSAWNSILASLALWDFLVLFFCLPIVTFHEITKQRLLGAVSCRAVPFVEVSSLGVTTFSLCALGIDRFHVATSTLPKARPVEPCPSILAKLAVIWVGSMTLAAPELLLWQLVREPSPATGAVDTCAMKPSAHLPESLYSLALTYQSARMWWSFGCYFCLPVLFTATCQLVTWRVRGPPGREPESRPGPQEPPGARASSTVAGLAAVHALCALPENVCHAVAAYLSAALTRQTLELLGLVTQFSAFFKAAVTPLLLLCVSRPLGRAFLDCCCCCCGEGCGGQAAPGGPRAKLHTELAAPGYFHKPREAPPLLALGTPC